MYKNLLNIRICLGHLDEISWYIQDQHHQKIAIAIRNISLNARKIADKVQDHIQNSDLETFKDVFDIFK